MPRRPRQHVVGGLYHAILRGNHRRVIFDGEADYLAMDGIVRTAIERYGARLYAYCWMPNHVHMAIEVGEPPLGRTMHLVASRYARLKQRQVPTTGHLFERRYRARLVAAESYLLALMRYIHLNPVRAGLARDPADYRWSSHRAYLGSVPGGWLAMAPTLNLFGADRPAAIAAYRRFMRDEPADEEIRQISAAPGGPRFARPVGTQPDQRHSASRAHSLEDLIREVAAETSVEVAQLVSAGRQRALVEARVEIARRALRAGIAPLSEVARRLHRAPSSLSELLAKSR